MFTAVSDSGSWLVGKTGMRRPAFETSKESICKRAWRRAAALRSNWVHPAERRGPVDRLVGLKVPFSMMMQGPQASRALANCASNPRCRNALNNGSFRKSGRPINCR